MRIERPFRYVPNEPHPVPPEKFEIDDVDEAREYIRELIAKGVRPLITVPLEFSNVERDGIHFVPQYDAQKGKGYSFIAGTFNINPFLPSGERRAVFEVKTEHLKLEPRFTGNNAFSGVVGFPNGINADQLVKIGEFTPEEWTERGQEKDPLQQAA